MSQATKKIAIGAALAGAAGYVAGILTAPKSGKQTRDDIAEATTNSVSDIERELKQLHTELGTLLSDAKQKSTERGEAVAEEMKPLVEKVTAAKQKVREVISTVHEGEASDKDLKKAISDAKKAIDHVKTFLQK